MNEEIHEIKLYDSFLEVTVLVADNLVEHIEKIIMHSDLLEGPIDITEKISKSSENSIRILVQEKVDEASKDEQEKWESWPKESY